MKRIILEGIDGSGKSTLAEMMADRLEKQTVIRPGFKHNEYGFTDYDDWLGYEFAMLFDAGRRTPVHDRFLYSEVVYGTTLRNHIDIEPSLYTKVLDEIRRDALLIYCRPPLEIVKETSTDNPQMEGVNENLGRLYDSYEDLMGGESEIYKNRFVIWDFTRHYWINHLNPVIRRYLV